MPGPGTTNQPFTFTRSTRLDLTYSFVGILSGGRCACGRHVTSVYSLGVTRACHGTITTTTMFARIIRRNGTTTTTSAGWYGTAAMARREVTAVTGLLLGETRRRNVWYTWVYSTKESSKYKTCRKAKRPKSLSKNRVEML